MVTTPFWIVIGALWALQGLTGALLVFNRELQQAVLTPRSDAPMPPLDQTFARASAAAAAPVTKLERFGAGERLLLRRGMATEPVQWQTKSPCR